MAEPHRLAIKPAHQVAVAARVVQVLLTAGLGRHLLEPPVPVVAAAEVLA